MGDLLNQGIDDGTTDEEDWHRIPLDRLNPMTNSSPQGGSGTAIGLVLAAVILGGALVWAMSIWSNTQMQMIKAPAEAIKEGIKGAADAIKPGN